MAVSTAHPSALRLVLEPFKCMDAGGGLMVMSKDPSIACATSQHEAVCVVAGMLCAALGLGVPAAVVRSIRRVRLGLVVAELVRKNELQAKPDQLKAHIEELAASYEKPQEVVRWYLGDNRRMAEVESVVIENNVTDFVLSKAKVSEKEISFDDLMAQN